MRRLKFKIKSLETRVLVQKKKKGCKKLKFLLECYIPKFLNIVFQHETKREWSKKTVTKILLRKTLICVL